MVNADVIAVYFNKEKPRLDYYKYPNGIQV